MSMSASLQPELCQTRSAQAWMQMLAGDLADRRSLLALLAPGPDPSEVWEHLSAMLVRRGFDTRFVALDELDAARLPADVLGEELGAWENAPSGTPRSVDGLLRCADLPEVIFLEGLERLEEDARTRWLELVARWASVSQGAIEGEGSSSRLCMIAPAHAVAVPPEASVRLEVRSWWGVVSPLELRLLCREEARGSGSSLGAAADEARALWREHLLAALCGSDLALAEVLWDAVCQEPSPLRQKLIEFADERGWNCSSLEEWGAAQVLDGSASRAGAAVRPPDGLRRLWAHGALEHTPEHGIELHTAALEVLGRRDDVEHRLWRGQASLLLPLVDLARLRLCAHLTRVYGPAWPYQWRESDSMEEREPVRANPNACGLGHLKWLLLNCDALRRERGWHRLARSAWAVRTDLAHYRPVRFRDFEALWREARLADGLL